MRKSLLLAGALVAFAVPSTAGAATVGINVGLTSQIPTAAGTGAQYGRSIVAYTGVATPNADTLAITDDAVNAFVAAGIKPIVAVAAEGTPPDPATYASFIGALAARYAGKVAAWEVWNEEDSALWWGTAGGNPAAYAALLRASYAGVHQYAPVFVGGMTGNNYEFLNSVYAALGGSSAGAFDGVATHTDTACSIVGPDSFYRNPDGAISEFSFLGLRSVHDVMAAHGDGGMPFWITELGWNTSTDVCNSGLFAGKKAGGVSEADQAKFLSLAWHCLQAYPYVTNALWFNLQDGGDGAPINRYGLLRPDGSAKPALQAFKDVAAGKDVDAGASCGDFSPPTITVTTPGENGIFFDVLPISVSATDPSGVGRISLSADGKLIRNFTTGQTDPTQYPKTLNGDIDWQGGKQLGLGPHTITVTALDGNGNSTTTTVHVNKVALSSIKGLAVKFKTFKISGKGANRSLSVGVSSATSSTIAFRATNKVNVVFQKLVKGKWKTAHKYTKGLGKGSKNPFTLKVKLEKAKWRVQATFPAAAPFKSAKSKYLTFKV